jgi:hypothetical protein
MRSYALYFPAWVVAALGAALVPLSVFIRSLRVALVYPMTLVAAAVTTALFLRMLFDARCRRGINAANAELRGDRPWPNMHRVKFSDPEWGLFGTRSGNRSLQVLRALLLFEFIVALVLTGRDRTDLLLLAAASFAVTMMLSIIHVGLNTQAQGT